MYEARDGGKRNRGRPRRIWREEMKKAMKLRGLNGGEFKN